MPQMFVDYSDNIQDLDKKALMLGLNTALLNTGLVGNEWDIKTRIQAVSDFMIGCNENNQAFIFVSLQALSGRTAEQKKRMTDALAHCLECFEAYDATGLEVQLCVEFTEMPRDIYRKFIKAH